MLLELKPINDPIALSALYYDPYIARVGHDHRPASPIEHEAVRYVGTYADGTLVGAFMVIESGFVELDVHALLTRRALKQSREFGKMMIRTLFENKEIARLTTYIMEELVMAKNYCLKLGFKDEGFRRDACMKDGQLIGLHIMGLTRNDWECAK